MMRVLVSGANGIVGRFVVEYLLASGHEVLAGVRRLPVMPPFSRHVACVPLSLDPARQETDAVQAMFEGVEGFVHAAFAHLPGRYRGGEGHDPEGFRETNLEGTLRLFEAARQAGVSRCVFLSSRAVYGPQSAGTPLTEDLPLRPESLYGLVKMETERALAAMDAPNFTVASLRATGVYGLQPGVHHKWETLARDYLAGRLLEDRVGTEIHGMDLAEAVSLLLAQDAALVGGRAFNASDLLLSHRAVLSQLQQETGSLHPLPKPDTTTRVGVMDTSRLRALGWLPGGLDRFHTDIALLAQRLATFTEP